MLRIIVATHERWLDSLHGASIIRLFESLSSLGYSIVLLMFSSESKVVQVGQLRIETLGVKRWLPVITIMRIYFHFLSLILRDRRASAIIVDSLLLPMLLPARVVHKTTGVMLNLSRPVLVGGVLGKIRLLRFRFSLMLAKHLAEVITAISPFEAREFSKLGRIPEEQMVIISSPIDSIFTRQKLHRDMNQTRRRLGIGHLAGKKILLYHGALEEARGTVEFVAAFARAFLDRPDVALLIVGEGSARALVEDRIRRDSMVNCFLISSVPYSTVPELISACDLGLVILPNHEWWRYQCPTRLAEFLAMGKPVVATDLPGIRWVAQSSKLVTYLRNLEIDEVRNAIERALKQADPRTAHTDIDLVGMFTTKSLARRLDSVLRQGKIHRFNERTNAED